MSQRPQRPRLKTFKIPKAQDYAKLENCKIRSNLDDSISSEGEL